VTGRASIWPVKTARGVFFNIFFEAEPHTIYESRREVLLKMLKNTPLAVFSFTGQMPFLSCIGVGIVA